MCPSLILCLLQKGGGRGAGEGEHPGLPSGQQGTGQAWMVPTGVGLALFYLFCVLDARFWFDFCALGANGGTRLVL